MNVQLLIDNSDLDAASGRKFERTNPVTGAVATTRWAPWSSGIPASSRPCVMAVP